MALWGAGPGPSSLKLSKHAWWPGVSKGPGPRQTEPGRAFPKEGTQEGLVAWAEPYTGWWRTFERGGETRGAGEGISVFCVSGA